MYFFMKMKSCFYFGMRVNNDSFQWLLLEIRDIPLGLRSTLAISLFWPFVRGFGTTTTTLPKCGMFFPRVYIVLGRSLLSARPLRPSTLTPQNFNYDQSAVIAPSGLWTGTSPITTLLFFCVCPRSCHFVRLPGFWVCYSR